MRAFARRAFPSALSEGSQRVSKVSKTSSNEEHLPELQDPAEEITSLAWEAQDDATANTTATGIATATATATATAIATTTTFTSTSISSPTTTTFTSFITTTPAAFKLSHHQSGSLPTETSQHQLPHQPSQVRPTITFWSNDLHIAPIGDLKNLFGRIYPGNALQWFDHSFSVYCKFTDTCVKSSKVKSVLNWEKLFTNVMNTGDHPKIEDTITQFYQTFRFDPDIQQVDAFVCTHFVYMCRLFIPFSKPIIADIAWAQDWMLAHPDWKKIFFSKYNVAVVNNGYLQLRSRTWIKNQGYPGNYQLKLVPNLCLYTQGKYISSPDSMHKPYLVMRKPWPESLYSASRFTNLALQAGVPMAFVQYPKGITWKSIAENFKAVIYCPYINSAMVFYETYNMNVPMFMPSMALAMVNGNVYGGHWVGIAPSEYSAMDYYSGDYPHLIYWNSPAHLLTILSHFNANDYTLISNAMAKRTAELLKVTQDFWEKQLSCILSIRNPGLPCTV